MKRICISLFSIIIITFISCNHHNKFLVPFLNTSNLASSFISIKEDSSYILKTSKGAVIKIAKNSFAVPANATVKIELKEAYTNHDILLAGLITKSNGKLLQSGGMIYLNATVDGTDVKIIKPIHISIPTNNYNDSMQLFKGEIKPDSTINWVDPSPLDSTAFSKGLSIGKALFKANCANCHKPTEDFTGPALAGARKREPNAEWAYRFVNNVNTMLQTDSYAFALKRKFGSTMTQQNLTLIEIKDILDYCDHEQRNVSAVKNSTAKLATDSMKIIAGDDIVAAQPCGYDTIYSNTNVDTSIEILPQDSSATDTTSYINNLTQFNNTPSIYDFNINACGWYNIDCFVTANQALVTNVLLSAIINTVYTDSFTSYLCIPDRKLMANGNKQEGKFTFDYNYINDTIPLILNDNAMIIVIGRIDNKTYYGITKFTVAEKQVIKIDIKESSPEKITEALLANRLDSFKIDDELPTDSIVVKDRITSPPIQEIQFKKGKIKKIVPIYTCSGDAYYNSVK
jgi:hypothetical protein